MADIRTVLFDPIEPGKLPQFDWLLNEPSLDDDNGLTTAVIMSLFTDRLANDDDVIPDGTDDRRGWWGDVYSNIQDDRIGSRIWLLSREKDMQIVVNRAKDYAMEALQWLIDDGVANQVQVRAGWVDKVSGAVTDSKTNQSRPGVLGLEIIIQRNQAAPVKFQFNDFWKGNNTIH